MALTNVKNIALVVALFAVVGVGLGLTGYISIDAANQQFVDNAEGEFMQGIGQLFVGVLVFQSGIMTFFLGSVVASVGAVSIASVTESRMESVITNGAASFVGFYVMVVLTLVIMLAAFSSGDGSGGGTTSDGGQSIGDFGRFAKPLVIAGLPTTLVGLVSGGVAYGLE